MKRRGFFAACFSSVALLLVSTSVALADRFEFRIKRQDGHHETVVVHADNRKEAEKKLRKDHPNCVVVDVKHTKHKK